MPKIVVGAGLVEQFSKQRGDSIVCDENGLALGFFSPLPSGTKLDDLQLESPLSIAECQELRKDRTGKPLREILGRRGLQ